MKEEMYINLSGIYDGFPSEINCKDIAGTNCYCDNEAKKLLRQRLDEIPLKGLHFIDSGNYHYLSYLFLEKIEEDFALVLLDHHPDYQPPSFGDILSCGGWVKNANEDFIYLKEIYMIDVDEKLFHQLEDLPSNVHLVSKEEVASISREFPIYISIDKDVLRTEEVATDWDQGTMSVEELLDILDSLLDGKVLGVDVCGEKKEEPAFYEREKSEKINRIISNYLDRKNPLW